MTRSTPIALVAAALLASCTSPYVDVSLRAQRFAVDGDVGATAGGGVATSSLDDVGLGTAEWELTPRIDAGAGPVRFTFDAFRVERDGTGTLTADFTVEGQTISVGAPVAGDIALGLTRLIGTFTIVPLEVFHFGLGLGVAFAEFEAEVRELGTATSVETDENTFVPFLAARAGGSIGPFGYEVLAGFLEIDAGSVDVRYFDVDAMLRWRLVDTVVHVDLVGGYRFARTRAGYDDGAARVEYDLDLTGPFLGVSIGL